MRLLYHLGIIAYGFLIRLSAMLGNTKAREWVEGRRNWKSRLAQALQAKPGRWVWVHCASLGEFEQGRPLIEAIRAQHPDYQILLTFYSPSGYRVRKHYAVADHVDYLPLDTPRNARTFVDIAAPSVVCFVKYEFWLNTLNALHAKRIPVILVSGIFRPGQVFFRWYGALFRNALRRFKVLFLQDESSFRLLRSAGIPADLMIVAGDTRFDRVLAIAEGTAGDSTLTAWCGNDRVIVAGSTWEEDERALLPSVAEHFLPDVRLLIAPHEVHEAAVQSCIARLEDVFGKDAVVRYTRLAAMPESGTRRVLVLDTMGQLASAYRIASIAFVGGGFGNGIHNILEAAVWGVPVLFGPNHARFREAHELIAARGGQSVRSADELSGQLRHFLLDDHARIQAGQHASDYVRGHAGATRLILFQLGPEGDHRLFV